MIIVKLMGGLGNQMFQYAAGRRLAHKHNTQLKLDISFLKSKQEGCTHRTYELKRLNISEVIAKPKELVDITGKGISLYQNILSRFRQVAGIVNIQPNVYSEQHFHFDPGCLTASDNVYLEGYWQSEKYFKEIEGIIRRDFSVRAPLTGKNLELAGLIKSTDSVSVHVRRCDFVAATKLTATHGICGAEYYARCLKKIRSTVKAPHFFVFSDESSWVRENIRFPFPMTVVDHNPPDKGYEDMRLMSLCRHNIIANSTFSWWSAWLNNNPEKIVISPIAWFEDKTHNTDDVIPSGWLKI